MTILYVVEPVSYYSGGESAFSDEDFEYGSVEDLLEDRDSRSDSDLGSVIELLENQERREKKRY